MFGMAKFSSRLYLKLNSAIPAIPYFMSNLSPPFIPCKFSVSIKYSKKIKNYSNFKEAIHFNF